MVKKDSITSFWRITAPHPAVLATAVSKKGKPNIISLAWAIPASIKPPLFVISVGKTRYTHQLLEETGEYVVNVPTKELADKVQFCGSVSGRSVDKIAKSGLTLKPAKKVKPPIIAECIAHIECKVINKVSAGDHTLFVGEVLAAYAEDAFTDKWDISKVKLLQHVGVNTYSTPSEPFNA